MPVKTAFRLIQVLVLSMLISVSFAQDSARLKPRNVMPKSPSAKPLPAVRLNPVQVSPKNIPAVAGSAQTSPLQPATPANTTSIDKSISGQHQFILSKVYAYQRPMINDFYKTVQDTLRSQRSHLADLQTRLAAQTKNLVALQTDVDTKEQSLNTTNAQLNSINFLGIPVSKTSYNMMMWGLVIVLAILAASVIFLSGSARRESGYRTKLYNELEEEYKGYKTKANEKEKKLSRELQTVRNKLEEITGNPEY